MLNSKMLIASACLLGLAACGDSEGSLYKGVSSDKSVDLGIDKKHLSQLQAGIWVDPNGCHHWIIDDGVEGYLSARLNRKGRPVCSDIAPPNHTVGDFKGGSKVRDPN